MAFGIKSIGKALSLNNGGGLGNLVRNPVKWGENAFMSANPIGLSLGAFDRATGGSGSFKSSMGNPYIQFGSGVAASFVPGLQWYAAPAIGAGMGVLSGGNLEDDLQGASMSSAGYGAGSMGQTAYGSATAPGGILGPSKSAAIGAEFGTETGLGGYTAAEAAGAAGPYGVVGDIGTMGPGYASLPATASSAATPAPGGSWIPTRSVLDPAAAAYQGGAYAAPAEGALNSPQGRTAAKVGAGGGFSPGQMIGLKTGLGALQNFQTQKALRAELGARNDALADIQAYEDDPELMYAKDPGLRKQRDMIERAARNTYAAKHGGTLGSEAAVAREVALFNRQALNDTIARRSAMLGLTAPAQQVNLQAGGTGLGALANAGQYGLSDYAQNQSQDAFQLFLQSIYGR